MCDRLWLPWMTICVCKGFSTFFYSYMPQVDPHKASFKQYAPISSFERKFASFLFWLLVLNNGPTTYNMIDFSHVWITRQFCFMAAYGLFLKQSRLMWNLSHDVTRNVTWTLWRHKDVLLTYEWLCVWFPRNSVNRIK